jgi:hypothetical protein
MSGIETVVVSIFAHATFKQAGNSYLARACIAATVQFSPLFFLCGFRYISLVTPLLVSSYMFFLVIQPGLFSSYIL